MIESISFDGAFEHLTAFDIDKLNSSCTENKDSRQHLVKWQTWIFLFMFDVWSFIDFYWFVQALRIWPNILHTSLRPNFLQWLHWAYRLNIVGVLGDSKIHNMHASKIRCVRCRMYIIGIQQLGLKWSLCIVHWNIWWIWYNDAAEVLMLWQMDKGEANLMIYINYRMTLNKKQ